MLAHPSSPATAPSDRRSRRAERRRRTHIFHPTYRPQIIEIAIKFSMNVLFIWGCVAALLHLIPQITNQQRELREIQTETRLTRIRVEHLQADFDRYFDPQQAKSVMQEQGHRVDPSQRRVVFLEPKPTPTPEESPLPLD